MCVYLIYIIDIHSTHTYYVNKTFFFVCTLQTRPFSLMFEKRPLCKQKLYFRWNQSFDSTHLIHFIYSSLAKVVKLFNKTLLKQLIIEYCLIFCLLVLKMKWNSTHYSAINSILLNCGHMISLHVYNFAKYHILCKMSDTDQMMILISTDPSRRGWKSKSSALNSGIQFFI